MALLMLYVTVTAIVASVCAFLWAMERATYVRNIDTEEDILAYARGFLLAPLWPLFLVRATIALIADATTSLKGNTDESE